MHSMRSRNAECWTRPSVQFSPYSEHWTGPRSSSWKVRFEPRFRTEPPHHYTYLYSLCSNCRQLGCNCVPHYTVYGWSEPYFARRRCSFILLRSVVVIWCVMLCTYLPSQAILSYWCNILRLLQGILWCNSAVMHAWCISRIRHPDASVMHHNINASYVSLNTGLGLQSALISHLNFPAPIPACSPTRTHSFLHTHSSSLFYNRDTCMIRSTCNKSTRNNEVV